MSKNCSCGFRPNALFFPYRSKGEYPNRLGFWLAAIIQLSVPIVVIILWLRDVDLSSSNTGTVATIFGTFTIAMIGYSAWARQKLTDLSISVSELRPQKEAQEEQPHNELLSCVRCVSSAIKGRIDLHMMFGAFAYGMLLLLFVTEKSLPDNWAKDIEAMQAIAIAWFIPNLILLGTVATSLNDFLDDAQQQVQKRARQ